MKCYYEILEIARDADDSEIKSAYRKLALRWHPDKNLDNSELAKEQFQLVQQAYEVLSDRHERAWYDNHREQILRGSDSTYEDNSLDVFQYFTTQCFKGYNDEEKGFYTVYRNVFEQIAKEDIEYMDSKSDYDEIPTFGSSISDYEEIVAPFYAYWMSYCTKKSYVWLDPYNINETRERRVLKLIEKENKKVRQKAKKERNEEIRNLVAFVRKRDKRVQAYAKKLETKNAENRVKHEERRKQKILERKKEIHTKKQADWSKFDNVQKELKEIEKNLAAQFGEVITDSDENSEEENEDLYCVACNKVFKNPKAFANHESSKKHKENVEKLKLTMLEEENEFEDIENISSDIDNISSVSSKNEEIKLEDFEYSSEETNSSIKKKSDEIKDEENEIDASISSDTEEILNISSKKKNKKNKKVIRINHEHLSDHESNEETKIKFEEPKISDDDFDFGSSKNQKKKKNKNKTPQEPTNKPIITENGDETIEKTAPNTKKQLNNKIKLNKTKIPVDLDDIDTSHVCVTCKSNFNSKNKLFDHLKKTGHSVLIPQQKTTKSKKKLK